MPDGTNTTIRTRSRAPQPDPVIKPLYKPVPRATFKQVEELNRYARQLTQRYRNKRAVSPMFYEVADGIRHQWTRRLMPTLKPAEYMVASVVMDRSLGWRDFAKVITLAQFTDGIRDECGELKVDKLGVPYFSGAGLSRRYVRDTLNGLVRKGHLDRLPVQANNTYLWFPAARADIAKALRDLGCDPAEFPRLLVEGL